MSKKAVCLMSDGLDSPIATFLIEQTGLEVIGVNFSNFPLVGFTKSKEVAPKKEIISQVPNIAQTLVNQFSKQKTFDVYFMPQGEDLDTIINSIDNQKLVCVLCKRLMLRKAERVAKEVGAEILVTGEILGEQASQTLENLKLIDSVLEAATLVRPNVGLNKEEIIRKSRELNTYQHSELAAKYTCLAVPNKPSTKAKLEDVLKAEQQVNIDEMITSSWNSATKMSFSKKA
ncbi:MAG: hypothetical protein ACTSQX_09740 [Candidatus Heimdallarchaeota archaeon]